jgi:molecular chaperone GrpE
MSFRRGLRLARTLTTRELQLQSASRQRRCVSTASWRQHRPLVIDVHSRSPRSTTAGSASDYHHQRFYSANPPNADPSTADADIIDGASSTKDTKEGNVDDDATDDDDEGVEYGETRKITIAHLETQIKDLKDNLLRSLAEQENIRRIAARDVANAKSYAISSFAKSLLDTSDDLTRALAAVPIGMRTDRAHHPILANLYEGISMTEINLNKAFNKFGLVKFGNVGEKFDPNLHMALFEYPRSSDDDDSSGGGGTGSPPPGHIGQVMKVGFMLNDRVIRSAEVGVVKAS